MSIQPILCISLREKNTNCVFSCVNQPYTEGSIPTQLKNMLPRGQMPIPNRLTVSVAGNPPLHKEARYDTTGLQAREEARDSIDRVSAFVWENS